MFWVDARISCKAQMYFTMYGRNERKYTRLKGFVNGKRLGTFESKSIDIVVNNAWATKHIER